LRESASDQVGGGDILGTLVSDICFRRADVVAARSCLDACSGDIDGASRERCRSVFLEKLLDHPLGLVVLAFAEVWYARAQDCQDAANKGQQVDQHGSVASTLTTSEFYPHFL